MKMGWYNAGETAGTMLVRNDRTSRYRGKLFYRLIQQAVSIEPVIAKNIRGGKLNELNHYI